MYLFYHICVMWSLAPHDPIGSVCEQSMLRVEAEAKLCQALHSRLCLEPSVVVSQIANLLNYTRCQARADPLSRTQVLSLMKPQRLPDFESEHFYEWYGPVRTANKSKTMSRRRDTAIPGMSDPFLQEPVSIPRRKRDNSTDSNEKKKGNEGQRGKAPSAELAMVDSALTSSDQAAAEAKHMARIRARANSSSRPSLSRPRSAAQSLQLLRMANFVFRTNRARKHHAHNSLLLDRTFSAKYREALPRTYDRSRLTMNTQIEFVPPNRRKFPPREDVSNGSYSHSTDIYKDSGPSIVRQGKSISALV